MFMLLCFFKNGLARWAKQIENGIYLINGQVKDEDCDLLEGQVSQESHLMKLFVLKEKIKADLSLGI